MNLIRHIVFIHFQVIRKRFLTRDQLLRDLFLLFGEIGVEGRFGVGELGFQETEVLL